MGWISGLCGTCMHPGAVVASRLYSGVEEGFRQGGTDRIARILLQTRVSAGHTSLGVRGGDPTRMVTGATEGCLVRGRVDERFAIVQRG